MKNILIGFILGLVATSYAQTIDVYNTAVKIPLSTVTNLPTCSAATEGLLRGVTDALTPVALASVVGGGAVRLSAYCNGTAWIVQ